MTNCSPSSNGRRKAPAPMQPKDACNPKTLSYRGCLRALSLNGRPASGVVRQLRPATRERRHWRERWRAEIAIQRSMRRGRENQKSQRLERAAPIWTRSVCFDTGLRRVNCRTMRPDTTKAPGHMREPREKPLASSGASTHDSFTISVA